MPSTSVVKPWSAYWRISSSQTQLYNGSATTMLDSLVTSVDTNPGGENPFNVFHKSLEGSLGINKVSNPPKGFSTEGPSDFGSLVPVEASGPSWTGTNIWARTNPARPSVLLPVYWLELKDIPDMIRQAGRFLFSSRNWRGYIRNSLKTRDLATANLAFQFGWAPLLGDMYKLATFQDAVEKRRQEIMAATAHGGYRRRISLGQSTVSASGTRFANFGSFTNYNVSYRSTSTAKSWAEVKWKPTLPGAGLPLKDDDLRPYLNGLHPSHILANVWEALPWSWLIDYFLNVGSLIQAGNHHMATPAGGSVMTTTVTNVTHPRTENGTNYYLSAGELRQVRKQRTPISSSLTDIARLPTLEAGQLSILGSLSVLKYRRSLGS